MSENSGKPAKPVNHVSTRKAYGKLVRMRTNFEERVRRAVEELRDQEEKEPWHSDEASDDE